MAIAVIFGGQFGSEGKGLMASYLAKKQRIDLATTDGGPNSGHTAIWDDEPVVTKHLPMVGVLSPGAHLWLNGGAIIHPEALLAEIEEFDRRGFAVSSRLHIHPAAAVISEDDVADEHRANGAMNNISSTQKGVGAAAQRKMGRGAPVAKNYPVLERWVDNFEPSEFIAGMKNISVEVAQGFSLGINAGFYPYTTHRACTPAQGLMNAQIPTGIRATVFAVIRTNPIRVGNLPGASSGDCYHDQKETTWEELGQQPQFTTVTKRLRRVFTYSQQQIDEMIAWTKPDVILINFAQNIGERNRQGMKDAIFARYRHLRLPIPSILFGYGPKPEDIA